VYDVDMSPPTGLKISAAICPTKMSPLTGLICPSAAKIPQKFRSWRSYGCRCGRHTKFP